MSRNFSLGWTPWCVALLAVLFAGSGLAEADGRQEAIESAQRGDGIVVQPRVPGPMAGFIALVEPVKEGVEATAAAPVVRVLASSDLADLAPSSRCGSRDSAKGLLTPEGIKLRRPAANHCGELTRAFIRSEAVRADAALAATGDLEARRRCEAAVLQISSQEPWHASACAVALLEWIERLDAQQLALQALDRKSQALVLQREIAMALRAIEAPEFAALTEEVYSDLAVALPSVVTSECYRLYAWQAVEQCERALLNRDMVRQRLHEEITAGLEGAIVKCGMSPAEGEALRADRDKLLEDLDEAIPLTVRATAAISQARQRVRAAVSDWYERAKSHRPAAMAGCELATQVWEIYGRCMHESKIVNPTAWEERARTVAEFQRSCGALVDEVVSAYLKASGQSLAAGQHSRVAAVRRRLEEVVGDGLNEPWAAWNLLPFSEPMQRLGIDEGRAWTRDWTRETEPLAALEPEMFVKQLEAGGFGLEGMLGLVTFGIGSSNIDDLSGPRRYGIRNCPFRFTGLGLGGGSGAIVWRPSRCP